MKKQKIAIYNSKTGFVIQIGDIRVSGNIFFSVLFILIFLCLLLIKPHNNFDIQSGDINISIAKFLELEKGKLVKNREYLGFSELIFKKVELIQEEGFTNYQIIVDIRPPYEIPDFKASSIQNMKEKAIDYAQSTNSDIMLYGFIEETSYGLEVHPFIYINESRFGDVVEITGQHELGSIIFEKSMLFSDTEKLSQRVTCLSMIVIPLSDFVIGEYEKAIEGYKAIIDSQCYECLSKKLIYLLIGNSYGRSGKFDLAESYFNRALEEDANYSRAYIGLSGLAHINAVDALTEGNDAEALIYMHKEEELLGIALKTNDSFDENILGKVNFSLGQMEIMYYLISKNTMHLLNATQYYNEVIGLYEDGNESIVELVAQSYGGIGLIQYYGDNLEEAYLFYQKALELSSLPDRKCLFNKRMCEILMIQGDSSEAKICISKLLKRYSDIMSEEDLGYLNSLNNSMND